MEALLNRVAKLGAGVAAAAFVGNNFLYTGQSAHLLDPFIDGSRIPRSCAGAYKGLALCTTRESHK